MTEQRDQSNAPPGCYDAWLEFWLDRWEWAYSNHHPLVALYCSARGFLRALRLDLHLARRQL
jgi:hypothetical protein